MQDIKTDDDLIAVLNDLKHYLKGGIPYSPLRADFNETINDFLRKHRLDTDPQAFASLPEAPAPKPAQKPHYDVGRALALSVSCPTCGVPEGNGCDWSRGPSSFEFGCHQARVDDARRMRGIAADKVER